MDFKISCHGCGKILWFSTELAGQTTICPACGSLNVLPALDGEMVDSAAIPPDDYVNLDEGVPPVVKASAASAVTTAKDRPMPAPTAALGPARRSWAVPLLIGICVILAAFVTAILMSGPTPSQTWQETHRQQIITLKQQAEADALSGHYRQAYDHYQELERLVNGQKISDPALQSELSLAWKHREQIWEAAMREPATPAPPSQPPHVEPTPPPHEALTQPQSQPIATTVPTAVTQPAPQPVAPPRPALTRPLVHPMRTVSSNVTDAVVEAAIKKGVGFLIDQFDNGQIPADDHFTKYHDGVDCLAVYALLTAGQAVDDPRLQPQHEFMKAAIANTKKYLLRDGPATYGRALRAAALAVYYRPEDRIALQADVEWLRKAQRFGAYSYDDKMPADADATSYWDNSNSQYGLYGVWAGAEAGIPVKAQEVWDAKQQRRVTADYWKDVQKHWEETQLPNGQWYYYALEQRGNLSMTLAGIASLLVCHDYLEQENAGDPLGSHPYSKNLAKALDWLNQGDNSILKLDPLSNLEVNYTAYGTERVGLASGLKYFGTHDWYREIAAQLLERQFPDGSWPKLQLPPAVETSYALLFLSRGRHPIVMAKLQFPGAWSNHPRDVYNLTHFVSQQTERPLNWEVAPLEHDWHDWADSPILFLASHQTPELDAQAKDKLRQYVANGGMLVTQADGNSPEFNRFADSLGKELFPQYSWQTLPDTHPLFNVSFKLPADLKLQAITNGSRILMLHLDRDYSKFWRLKAEPASPDSAVATAYHLGMNLILYAISKTDFRNRLAVPAIPNNAAPPRDALDVARLRYNGDWNFEPAAWPRFARWFQQQTGLGVNLRETEIADLSVQKTPLAHLNGTGELALTEAQIQALAHYVDDGGVLLVDCAGNPGDFYTAVREKLLAKAFGDDQLVDIPRDHPLLTASGDGMSDVGEPRLRLYAKALTVPVESRPKRLRHGKGWVIVCPVDLTSGLLDVKAWGVLQYQSDYALELAKNIVLWTWDGARP